MSHMTTAPADYAATPGSIQVTPAWADDYDGYGPSGRAAPRSGRRIAMHVRREQERRQSGGW